MLWFIVAVGAFVAGTVQTLTGFGAGVIMVLLLSTQLGMIAAPAVNTSICLGLTTVLTVRYWKSIEFRKMALPIALYTVLSAVSIYFVTRIDKIPAQRHANLRLFIQINGRHAVGDRVKLGVVRAVADDAKQDFNCTCH